jgi:hypothetical protein
MIGYLGCNVLRLFDSAQWDLMFDDWRPCHSGKF